MTKVYKCSTVDPAGGSIPWEQVESISLVEVVGGGAARLRTQVRACRTESELCFLFECEDDHVVATMERHDDPLYDEDVVELFLDVRGGGTGYYELEVSPRGVVFDAFIRNDLQGSFETDTSWHLQDAVVKLDGTDALRLYELRIPFANFGGEPEPGASWGWNAYRIDDDPEGKRHYWAWSPTGEVNFHRPASFGRLMFA